MNTWTVSAKNVGKLCFSLIIALIFQGPLFDRLRRFKPGIFSKLIPVGGDIMEEGLGLNQLDMQTICDEVSIGKSTMQPFC